ncbi:hypothetical protein GCM10010169_35020 [Micromonospora fulviviridis]|nr:hypothetical protein GCM10010169_35020 [Micromonospora fulviviridis]
MRPAPDNPAADACRRDLARDLLADLRCVDRQFKANEVAQRDAVAATGSTLSEVHGIAIVPSAKILGHVGDVTRFPTSNHFASYTATSPLDASSGNRNRHRLNTGGNRQLNSALHTIAVCQPSTRAREGSTTCAKSARARHQPKPARALKRCLANVIYRHIGKDQKRRAAMPT